jgi:hypothetical protein
MTTRRILIAVLAISAVLLVAIGSSRASVDGQPCPDRVWKAAAQWLTDDASDPFYACTAKAQERVFAVAGGIMGLVLISGILSRRD